MAFHATSARLPRARRLTRIRARFDSAALRAAFAQRERGSAHGPAAVSGTGTGQRLRPAAAVGGCGCGCGRGRGCGYGSSQMYG